MMLNVGGSETEKTTRLFKMRVVADVPSIEMDETRERAVMGISSSNEKRVAFHELTQSMLSSLYLDNKPNVSVLKLESHQHFLDFS